MGGRGRRSGARARQTRARKNARGRSKTSAANVTHPSHIGSRKRKNAIPRRFITPKTCWKDIHLTVMRTIQTISYGAKMAWCEMFGYQTKNTSLKKTQFMWTSIRLGAIE